MTSILDILAGVLEPLGFKRSRSSWYHYRKGLLTRIHYYGSNFGGPGHLEVVLTVSDKPIEKEPKGAIKALTRVHKLIPSGNKIYDMLVKNLSDDAEEELRSILNREASPIFQRLLEPKTALEIINSTDWMQHRDFRKELHALIETL